MGVFCGRGANCKVLEGIHQILVFPYCRRLGGRILLKQSSNKQKRRAAVLQAKGREQSTLGLFFIASIVKFESLDQDFCAAGIRCCASSGPRCSGSGSWFAATAVGSPAQTVLSQPRNK